MELLELGSSPSSLTESPVHLQEGINFFDELERLIEKKRNELPAQELVRIIYGLLQSPKLVEHTKSIAKGLNALSYKLIKMPTCNKKIWDQLLCTLETKPNLGTLAHVSLTNSQDDDEADSRFVIHTWTRLERCFRAGICFTATGLADACMQEAAAYIDQALETADDHSVSLLLMAYLLADKRPEKWDMEFLAKDVHVRKFCIDTLNRTHKNCKTLHIIQAFNDITDDSNWPFIRHGTAQVLKILREILPLEQENLDPGLCIAIMQNTDASLVLKFTLVEQALRSIHKLNIAFLHPLLLSLCTFPLDIETKSQLLNIWNMILIKTWVYTAVQITPNKHDIAIPCIQLFTLSLPKLLSLLYDNQAKEITRDITTAKISCIEAVNQNLILFTDECKQKEPSEIRFQEECAVQIVALEVLKFITSFSFEPQNLRE